MCACDNRQLTQAQRAAAFQQQGGVTQAVRPFTGAPSLANLIDYINRELFPAVKASRNKVNDVYDRVRDNAPSGNPLQFYFATETASGDPTTGRIRLNQASQETATVIRVSETNGRLQDVVPWLDVMAGGATTPLGTITLSDVINPARFLRFDLNTMVDQGDYWDLGVTIIESSHENPFVDESGVVIAFTPGVAAAGATVPPSAITPIADDTFLANIAGASAAPTAVPLTTLAGAGLTGGENAIVNVGAGTGITVNTNDVAWSGINVSENGGGASGFFWRHLDFDDTGTVAVDLSASDAGNRRLNIAYDVVADSITNTLLANMAQARIKGRAVAAGTGDPQDLTGLEVGSILRMPGPTTSGGFLSGTYDNYSVDETLHYFDVSATGNVIFTGFAVTGGNTGAFFWITKFGASNTITIAHQDTGSLAANRVSCPGGADFVMREAGASVLVMWVNNRLQLLAPQSLSVEFPGAPIYDVMAAPFFAAGDGTTDDTAALNAAIAAANAVPGMIYLGADHRITSALDTITGNNIIIKGRGRHQGGSAISIDAPSADDFIVFEGQYNGIEDVWLKGIGPVYTTGSTIQVMAFQTTIRRVTINGLPGIDINGGVLTKIEEITLEDVYGTAGIHVHGTLGVAHATWISNSLFTNTFDAAPVGTIAAWAAATVYATGAVVIADGKYYQAQTGGTSGATGPSGVPGTDTSNAHTTTIADGSVLWVFAMTQNDWILFDSFAHTCRVIDCAFLQGGRAIHMTDSSGGTSPPQFLRVVNAEADHVLLGAILLDGGQQAEFEQLFVTSMYSGYAIEVAATFTGGWRFDGGWIFASPNGLVRLAAPDGILSGMVIGGASIGFSNTYDAVTIAASTSNWQIEDCTIGRMPGSTSPQSRYGINIGSGCDNYIVTGNRLTGHVTAGVLNTPGVASTRIVRNNIPDTATGLIPDGDYGDITVSSSGTVWNIDADVVTNTELNNMNAGTIKGRQLGSSGDPQDLTGVQAGAIVRWSGTQSFTLTAGTTNTITVTDGVTYAYVSISGTGDVVIDAIVYGSSNTGARLVIAKNTGNGRVILRNNTGNGANQISTINSRDWIIQGTLGASEVFHNGSSWCMDAIESVLGARINSGGTTFTRPRLNFINGTGISWAIGEDSTDLEIDLTPSVTVPLTDGDKGDITVSSTGTVWTIDNSAVTLAKMANLAASRIIGQAEGASTVAPIALTPTQVVAIIDGESPTWTGDHTFNGGALTANVTTADILLGANPGAIGLFAGQATANVNNGDLVLNSAAGGIAINATGVAQTNPTNGNIELTATGLIDMAAATLFGARVRFNGLLSSSVTGNVNDLDVQTVNVVRLSPDTSAHSITGMVAGGDGQVVLLVVASSASQSLRFVDESDTVLGTASTAANRFKLAGTTSLTASAQSIWLAWYDGTSDRWRIHV